MTISNVFARLLRGVLISSVVTLLPAHTVLAQTVTFDLPEQQATSGIPEFARQAGIQIIAPLDSLKGVRTHQVSGAKDMHAALRQLLEGTGLVVSSDDGHTISLRLAPARLNDAASLPHPDVAEPLNEIIVTAQKKNERLQDVPVPVGVIDTRALTNNNHVMLRDYFGSVPGLSVTPDFVASQLLSIRGIGTNTNPTVAVMIDDAPFTDSTATGVLVPDIDPGDLSRIEVLKGPQGTLYGANSMGGLLKFVTIDPTTDGFSGHFSAGTSSVKQGADLGFNFRGSANIPVTDTFALRASFYTRQDPGYIDNPVNHTNGVNEAHAYGGRLAGLWKPNEDLSVKFSALYQKLKWGALNEVVTGAGLGEWQQNYLAGTGDGNHITEAYSTVVNYKLGPGQITSVTAFNRNRVEDSLDFGFLFSAPFQGIYQNPAVSGAPYREFIDSHKFSQELRFNTPITEYFDLLVGGFYTRENRAPGYSKIYAENPSTGEIVDTFYSDIDKRTYKEYAGFADITWKITHTFDIQFGGRESHHSYEADTTITGLYVPIFLGVTDPSISNLKSSDNVFTYLVTPRFRLSDDIMVYARFASGYRPGGPNTPTPGVPPSSAPDKTENYEVGIKGDFADHLLSVDASVYYIKWTNIQLQLRDPVSHYTYYTNGGAAKSEGVDLGLTVRPAEGLSVRGSFSYDKAVLTSFPADSTAYGVAGDDLPNTPRYSGYLAIAQRFPLANGVEGEAGADLTYVGARTGIFSQRDPDLGTPVEPRQTFPAYTTLDLHAGVDVDRWQVNLYANNVADKRGLLNGGNNYFYEPARIYITPRTIGVNVMRAF